MSTNRPRTGGASQSIDRLFLTVLLGALAILFAIGVLGWYVNERMDTFESEAGYRPPVSDGTGIAENVMAPTGGRTVYVPAYSHIYSQGGRPVRLAVTLSVRNINLDESVTVQSVQYFDSDGKLVRDFTEQPITMGPLGTKEFFVPDRDTTGGSGANFIVTWSSTASNLTPPLIEAVMISTAGQQGISFVSRGVEVGVERDDAHSLERTDADEQDE